jgi:hypothetical protein
LGKYLKNLRENGCSDMKFIMDDEFRNKFSIKEKSITFNTHPELDNFIINLQKINIDFELMYKDEWILLKSCKSFLLII